MLARNHRGLCLGYAFLLLTCAAHAQSRRVIHTFTGMDGGFPTGLISDAAGNLYGVAEADGKTGDCCGTAYKLSPVSGGWKFAILHKFSGGLGGSQPAGSFAMDAAGNLFGITRQGGIGAKPCLSTCGLVYELSPQPDGSWAFSVLYNFQGNTVGDGKFPNAGLILDSAGNLYGTTGGGGLVTRRAQCGSDGCGTVFKLTPGSGGWSESVLYRFSGHFDGAFPQSTLLFDGGNLKGTTLQGGGGPCSTGPGANGCGTIFELVPSDGSWVEHILYRFQGPDGEFPGDLHHDALGNLYGTTSEGGTLTFSCCGTAFKLSRPASGPWTLTTLYNFGANDSTGTVPNALIMDDAGNLYGTAGSGGAHDGGTFFKLTPSSDGRFSYSVVFPFDPDRGSGAGPFGNLVMDGMGTIYGTTTSGGHGTVYQVTP